MPGYDDNVYHLTFYGIYIDKFSASFSPEFVNHHYLLVDAYINEACATTEMSECDTSIEFLFPHHIRKNYAIEGIAKGQITFTTTGDSGYLYAYRVTICKVDESGNKDDLFSTNWMIVNEDISYATSLGIGEEKVYYFEIDCWQHENLDEYDRLYVRVDFDYSSCTLTSGNCDHTRMYHTNDATWEDFKIDIGFRW